MEYNNLFIHEKMPNFFSGGYINFDCISGLMIHLPMDSVSNGTTPAVGTEATLHGIQGTPG